MHLKGNDQYYFRDHDRSPRFSRIKNNVSNYSEVIMYHFFISSNSRVPSIMHDISGQRCLSTDSFAQFTDNSSHHSMSLCVFALALACEHWPLFIMQSTKIFIFYTIQYTVDFDYEFIRFIIYFK